MLKAAGFSDEDLRRPIIGVANTWIEISPCNYHLRIGCGKCWLPRRLPWERLPRRRPRSNVDSGDRQTHLPNVQLCAVFPA